MLLKSDFIVRFILFFLLVVNMYILIMNTSRRALKPLQDKETGYCAHKNERESPTCGRNSQAKAVKINEAEARRSTQTANA